MTSLQDGVATITIDNPSARNALDNATRIGLLTSLQEATSDQHCHAIVLTGAGSTFCAGGELSSMPSDEPGIRNRLGEMHEIMRLIHAGPKPVVAAVNGPAFGSGLSLVAACDLIVAVPEARFGCSFGLVGLVADTGLIWTLPRRIGWNATRRTLLESREISALDAYRIGLVDELVDSVDLVARARDWATTFTQRFPLAVAATRKLLAFGEGLDDFLQAEMNAQIELLASDDFIEGRDAFFERRRPNYSRGSRVDS